MPKKTIKPMTVSETLRSVLIDSKLPLKRIQIETGVPRNSLRRFIQGEQSLRSDLIDKLATRFNLALVKQAGTGSEVKRKAAL